MLSISVKTQYKVSNETTAETHALKRILQKINCIVEAVSQKKESSVAISTGELILKDSKEGNWLNPNHFLVAMNNALVDWASTHASEKFYKVDFGSDLSDWSLQDIASLKEFFSHFKQYPIMLTLDSTQ